MGYLFAIFTLMGCFNGMSEKELLAVALFSISGSIYWSGWGRK